MRAERKSSESASFVALPMESKVESRDKNRDESRDKSSGEEQRLNQQGSKFFLFFFCNGEQT